MVCRLISRLFVAKYPFLHLYHNLWFLTLRAIKKYQFYYWRHSFYRCSYHLSMSTLYVSICHRSICLSFIYQHSLDTLAGEICVCPKSPTHWSHGFRSQVRSFSLCNHPNCTILDLTDRFLVFLVKLYFSASISVLSMTAGCLVFTCFVQSHIDLLDG